MLCGKREMTVWIGGYASVVNLGPFMYSITQHPHLYSNHLIIPNHMALKKSTILIRVNAQIQSHSKNPRDLNTHSTSELEKKVLIRYSNSKVAFLQSFDKITVYNQHLLTLQRHPRSHFLPRRGKLVFWGR